MSTVRTLHISFEEYVAQQERNAQAAEAAGMPEMAKAYRAKKTREAWLAADNQWGWSK